MIYLDYNATAPVRPEVARVIADALADSLNASSVHTQGRKAKKLLEDARRDVAQQLSCFPNEVIFTASGTEANNMALRQAGDRPILVGATEHASVANLAGRLGASQLPVNRSGVVDLDALRSKLKSLGRPAFISVMMANNETGVIQPIAQIATIAREYDAMVHTDAVQVLGKAPLDIGLLGADMVTICAHKMGGPVGVGALIMRNDLPVKPQQFGGGQELGRRAGTESIALILGLVKALELASQDGRMQTLSAKLREAERTICAAVPSVEIAGTQAERLPNVLCAMLPGVSSETQLMHLDLAGFCVSAGSACSSGRIAPSYVLKAMGYGDAMAGSVIRMSAGWNTSDDEIDRYVDAYIDMARRLVKKAA